MKLFVLTNGIYSDTEKMAYALKCVTKYLQINYSDYYSSDEEYDFWYGNTDDTILVYSVDTIYFDNNARWPLNNLLYHHIPAVWYSENGKYLAYCIAECDIENRDSYDSYWVRDDEWEKCRDHFYKELSKFNLIIKI